MIEHVLIIGSSVMTMVVIPLVAIILKRLDKRSAERYEANRRFMGYVIWGLISIGDLSNACATALKNGSCNGETAKAQENYFEFAKALQKFKSEQTAKTL
jgi:hypothetical protein